MSAARLVRLVTVYRIDSRLATLFFDFQWNFSRCGRWGTRLVSMHFATWVWAIVSAGWVCVCNLAWRMVFSPIWGLINCFGVRSPAFAAMLGPSMHPAQYTRCIPCIHGPGIPVCNLQPPGSCCQTSYLSHISHIIYVEKKLSCGEFSAFHGSRLQGNQHFLYMWRNFKCLPMTDVEKSEILHIWHVCDVENVAIYAKFMLFSWKNQFCQNLRTLSQNPFCRN